MRHGFWWRALIECVPRPATQTLTQFEIIKCWQALAAAAFSYIFHGTCEVARPCLKNQLTHPCSHVSLLLLPSCNLPEILAEHSTAAAGYMKISHVAKEQSQRMLFSQDVRRHKLFMAYALEVIKVCASVCVSACVCVLLTTPLAIA